MTMQAERCACCHGSACIWHWNLDQVTPEQRAEESFDPRSVVALCVPCNDFVQACEGGYA